MAGSLVEEQPLPEKTRPIWKLIFGLSHEISITIRHASLTYTIRIYISFP